MGDGEEGGEDGGGEEGDLELEVIGFWAEGG